MLPLLFGGVSTLARMVWGTYLEKNCPSSNGHSLDCGGVKMLARMVWVTYTVKIEVQHQLLLNLTYNFNGTYRVKIRHLSLIYTT